MKEIQRKESLFFKLSYQANCELRKEAPYRENPEGKKNASRQALQSLSKGRVAERKCASNKVNYNKNG